MIARLRQQIATPADVVLAIRITLWTVVLRALKHVVPLETLVRSVRRQARGTASPERESQIVVLSRWAARAWTGASADTCLERALVRYRFLSELGADVRLVFGFARDGATVKGHAWIVINGIAIDEDETALSAFTPAGVFDRHGCLVTRPARNAVAATAHRGVAG